MNQEVAQVGRIRILASRNWLDSTAGIVLCCGLTVALATIGAVLRLPSHFWIDETATVWAVDGGFADIPARCTTFPLSVLYAWMIFGLRNFAGDREWVLRLPSFIAIALTAVVLFRMVRHRWGSLAGWLALALFVSLPTVRFAAGDARPYALGLLFAVLSTRLLLLYFEQFRLSLAVLYALSAGLLVHAHLMLAPLLFAHGVYLAYEFLRGRTVPARHILAAVVCLMVIVSPLVPSAIQLAGKRNVHTFANMPNVDMLIAELVPRTVMMCILAGFASAIVVRRTVEWNTNTGSDGLLLGALVALVPPLILFAFSVLSRTGVLLPRYFLPHTIGIALCFGAIGASIRPRFLAQTIAVTLAAMQLYSASQNLHPRHTNNVGDWASAIAYADRNAATDNAPVLMRSQLIESDTSPVSPVAGNPMFTQLTCYPSKSHVTGIATTYGLRQIEQMEQFLTMTARGRSRFLMIATDGPRPLAPSISYLSGRLGPGALTRTLANFDSVQVIELTLPH